MESKQVMRIINQSRTYKLRPSEVINIDDEYTAFCFDEACMFIVQMLEETDKNGKYVNEAKWHVEKEEETDSNNSDLIDAIRGLM